MLFAVFENMMLIIRICYGIDDEKDSGLAVIGGFNECIC